MDYQRVRLDEWIERIPIAELPYVLSRLLAENTQEDARKEVNKWAKSMNLFLQDRNWP